MTEEVKTGMCGLCGMHCRIGLRVRDGELVGVQSPWGKGSAIGTLLAGTITSCPRANAATEYLYHPLRLNFPLKKVGERGENRWQRISWEQALKVWASESVQRVVRHGQQIYGGVGFTLEYPMHLYFRRAKCGEVMYGNPEWHRRDIADALLGLHHEKGGLTWISALAKR